MKSSYFVYKYVHEHSCVAERYENATEQTHKSNCMNRKNMWHGSEPWWVFIKWTVLAQENF